MSGNREYGNYRNELHLKAVFESMDSLFVFVDPQFRIISFNKAMGEGLKKLYRRNVSPGDAFLDFIFEENRMHVAGNLGAALEGNVVQEEQRFFISTQGRNMWFSITYHPVYDDNKTIIGAAVHYRDIDRIKSAEQNAIEKEYQLNAVLGSMFASFAFFDLNFNLVLCSPRFQQQIERFLGKSFEFGKHILFYLPQADQNKVLDRVKKALNGEEIEIECTFFLEKENREVWVKQVYHPVYNSEQKLLGVAFHGMDIDKHKQAELELRRSYDRLSMVLNASHDAVWEMDIANGTVTRNENFTLLFGYEPEEHNQRFDWWKEHVHPEDKERMLELVNEAIKNQRAQTSIEYRFRCSNGDYKHVKDSFCILFDALGKPYRLIGSMQDINRLKTQQQTLLRQNTLLKDFAFVQSHMIRKPVANIAGLYDLLKAYLKDHSDSDMDLKAYLEQMHQSIQELDGMVQENIGKINQMKENEK